MSAPYLKVLHNVKTKNWSGWSSSVLSNLVTLTGVGRTKAAPSLGSTGGRGMGGPWVLFRVAVTFSVDPRSVGTVAPRVGSPAFVADVFVRAGFPGARPSGVEVIACASACDPVRGSGVGSLRKKGIFLSQDGRCDSKNSEP